jgi:hypothetical protein
VQRNQPTRKNERRLEMVLYKRENCASAKPSRHKGNGTGPAQGSTRAALRRQGKGDSRRKAVVEIKAATWRQPQRWQLRLADRSTGGGPAALHTRALVQIVVETHLAKTSLHGY